MSSYDAIRALIDTDAYKLGHIHMYPEGTEYVLSNFTDRGSRIEGITETVHFGLQKFLQSWLTDKWEPFFAATEDEVAAQYEKFLTNVLGPEVGARVGVEHIRALHRLGYLPLRFRSLPEGAKVPLRVPKFTVENTHPDFFWLTNYIETPMSSEIWQPATSATLADHFRQLLDEHAIFTTGSTAGVDWQGHDFSFRGMPGVDAAAGSGMGHALSFTGSDNLNVLPSIEDFYGDLTPAEQRAFDKNGSLPKGFAPSAPPIGSVPATEHSVATAFGPQDELGYFRSVLDANPTGIVSAVSDSYDLWKVLTEVLPELKDEILARDGKLVIRPDSGDPVDILAGEQGSYRTPEDRTPAEVGVVELLWNLFGGTYTPQGYKVLDSHIGVIYGDSITYDRAKRIMTRLEDKGFASTNVVFGVGSFTYQYQTRDTFMSAMKATWVQVNGEGIDIYKDPATDNGTKKSARGRIAVLKHRLTGKYELADSTTEAPASVFEGGPFDALETVWEDGKFVKTQTFAEVRARLGHIA